VSDDSPITPEEPAPPVEEPTTIADAPATPAAEPAPAAEPVTTEQPPPIAAAAPAAAAPAAPAAAAPVPPSPRRGGFFVPTWLAVVLAVLLIGGIGFAVGFVSADDGDSNSSNAVSAEPAPETRVPPRNTPGNEQPGNQPNGNDNSENTSQTAFLGVAVESAGNDGGARITQVRPGSPADDAGLKAGDVVTKVDGTTVQNSTDLIQAVRGHDPGDSVTVTFTRDGNSTTAKVELGRLSDSIRS
jgi:membrane-associated protease RseP (regulator of RpoE activity)